MDNTKQLLPFLKQLGHELEDKYTFINWGGCAVVAGMIGEHLQNFTDVKVIVYNKRPVDLDQARENMRCDPHAQDWDDQGVNFSHVLLEIEADGTFYMIDSENVAPSAGYNFHNRDRAEGHMTVEEAQQAGADADYWNPSFDRRQIPRIEETINDAFEKFAREVQCASL